MGKKAWIIGCGGCLTLIVVVVIAAVIWGVSSYNGMTEGAAKSVFGEKLPPGYHIIMGIPIPDKRGKQVNFVMMMNDKTSKIVLAIDTYSAAGANSEMKEMMKDPEALSAYMTEQLKHSNSKRSSKVESITIKPLKLNAKDTIPAMRMVMNQEGEYSPVSGTMLFYPEDRMVVLILMDPMAKGDSATSDFTSNFSLMEDEMIKLILGTDLSKNLEMVPPAEPAKVSWLLFGHLQWPRVA